uniref:Transmembrane protein n=1 Tax=Ascaris lumbricoides TaxID=6252 RepID=A0A0M3HH17_ASCLU
MNLLQLPKNHFLIQHEIRNPYQRYHIALQSMDNELAYSPNPNVVILLVFIVYGFVQEVTHWWNLKPPIDMMMMTGNCAERNFLLMLMLWDLTKASIEG